MAQITNRTLKVLNSVQIKSVDDLKQKFGINYLAPFDARKSHFPAESFDFISSTATLEHIPESDIRKILVECNRILKRRGG